MSSEHTCKLVPDMLMRSPPACVAMRNRRSSFRRSNDTCHRRVLILEADTQTLKAALYIYSVYVSGLPAKIIYSKAQAVQELKPESAQYAGRVGIACTFFTLARRVAVVSRRPTIGGIIVHGSRLRFG